MWSTCCYTSRYFHEGDTSLQKVFMGRGFTSGGQELGSVFSAAVCIIQASEHYVESSPLVLKANKPRKDVLDSKNIFSVLCLPKPCY